MSNQYLKQIDNVMQHELSRADFIKCVGVALISIIGITNFLKSFPHAVSSVKPKSEESSGYGKSSYGR